MTQENAKFGSLGFDGKRGYPVSYWIALAQVLHRIRNLQGLRRIKRASSFRFLYNYCTRLNLTSTAYETILAREQV